MHARNLFLALLLAPAALVAQQQPADWILYNGRIYTVDANRPLAEAMAVRDGRVIFVGSRRGVEALAVA